MLSVDLDIVLFKNPLDPAFNPWMNRELDVWTAIDNGRMLNCGFYFVRPSPPVSALATEPASSTLHCCCVRRRVCSNCDARSMPATELRCCNT